MSEDTQKTPAESPEETPLAAEAVVAATVSATPGAVDAGKAPPAKPQAAPAAKAESPAPEPAGPPEIEKIRYAYAPTPDPIRVLPSPLIPSRAPNGLIRLAMPLLGALPPRTRRAIEVVVADRTAFHSRTAAALNTAANFVFYIAIALGLNYAIGGGASGSTLGLAIVGGVLVGAVEGVFRYYGGPLWYRGQEQDYVLGAWYTLPVTILNTARANWATRRVGVRHSPFAKQWYDGAPVSDRRPMVNLELERDRQRRYGNVVRIEQRKNHADVFIELPRWAPEHAALEELGIERQLPHWDWQVEQLDNLISVTVRLPQSAIRRLSGRVNSLPAGFYKQLVFPFAIQSIEKGYDEETRVLHIGVRGEPQGKRAFDPFAGVGEAASRVA